MIFNESITPQYNSKIYKYSIFMLHWSVSSTPRKGNGPEDIAITTWYLDRLIEVPDLYLCSYYFRYFALKGHLLCPFLKRCDIGIGCPQTFQPQIPNR